MSYDFNGKVSISTASIEKTRKAFSKNKYGITNTLFMKPFLSKTSTTCYENR